MRYRALSADGDYTFGKGAAGFLINSLDGVVQAIQTRLALWTGEWFLDKTDGTPYMTNILGRNTQSLYDDAIKTRILGATGVKSILEYYSQLNNRQLSIYVKVMTEFGEAEVKL